VAIPELRPASQLAAAIEGLVKQLSQRTGSFTHSTLRTLRAAWNCVELCAPGVRADLMETPAMRILVADDDELGASCFPRPSARRLIPPRWRRAAGAV